MTTKTTKRCSDCREVLPVDCFYLSARDGLSGRCRQCNRLHSLKWSRAHPETNRQRARDYRAANVEAVRARDAEYRTANHQRLRAEQLERHAAERPMRHCEQCGELVSRYLRVDARFCSEACRAGAGRHRLNHRRRSRLRDAFVEDVVPLVLLERDDGLCGICDQDIDPDNFHIDHIVPLARGGEHSYANTQVAHPECNHRKNARLPEELAA